MQVVAVNNYSKKLNNLIISGKTCCVSQGLWKTVTSQPQNSWGKEIRKTGNESNWMGTKTKSEKMHATRTIGCLKNTSPYKIDESLVCTVSRTSP